MIPRLKAGRDRPEDLTRNGVTVADMTGTGSFLVVVRAKKKTFLICATYKKLAA